MPQFGSKSQWYRYESDLKMIASLFGLHISCDSRFELQGVCTASASKQYLMMSCLRPTRHWTTCKQSPAVQNVGDRYVSKFETLRKILLRTHDNERWSEYSCGHEAHDFCSIEVANSAPNFMTDRVPDYRLPWKSIQMMQSFRYS